MGSNVYMATRMHTQHCSHKKTPETMKTKFVKKKRKKKSKLPGKKQIKQKYSFTWHIQFYLACYKTRANYGKMKTNKNLN